MTMAETDATKNNFITFSFQNVLSTINLYATAHMLGRFDRECNRKSRNKLLSCR